MVEPDPSSGLSDGHLSIWPLRMRDSASAASGGENNMIVGRVDRYDGSGRLRPPTVETEFVPPPTGLSYDTSALGLYFSSISEFDGFRIGTSAGDTINMVMMAGQILGHMNNTSGAWLPAPINTGGVSLPNNYKDLQWFFRPQRKAYTDHHLKNTAGSTFNFSDADSRSPMKEIVYVLNGTTGPLYGLRLETWTGNQYQFPTKWWERDAASGAHKYIKPFNLITLGIAAQVSGATILNNVINPARKEFTVLNYTLTRRGRVTVDVFTLDGTQVRRLVSEVKEAGTYNISWDGLNQGGRPVARGMYFIRVVAPDIDEIRKVMVVK
jgi:hypothetical protein